MVDELPGLTLKPIGTVRSDVRRPGREHFEDIVSEIEVDESYTEGLDNLEEFSHIIVIYWLHEERRAAPMKVRPRHDPAKPLVGVFATRSPARPNPLGKATVRLLERRGNVLKVRGLDAIDGTPVLDIKPYIPGYDSVRRARAPWWVAKH